MANKNYCNDFFKIEHQKINFNFVEFHFLDYDPVYTLKKIIENLEFLGLLSCYLHKGRTGDNPTIMHVIISYAKVCKIRLVDCIIEL